MNKSVILDMDGVLADFEGAFCEEFGYNSRHLTSIEERYPEYEDDIELFVLSSATYDKLDVVPLGMKIAKWCHEREFDIYILSARPYYTVQSTGLWLKRNGIPFHFLEVGVQSKIQSIIRINPLFVVDDMLNVCTDCDKFQVYSMLIDWPWNQCNNLPTLVKRIRNFQDFEQYYQHILEVLGIF